MRYLVLICLLPACITEENFGETTASSYCKRLEDCDADAYASTYSSDDQCVEEVDDYGNCYRDNCETFIPSEAGTCVSELSEVGCFTAELPASCADAWEDCNAIPLGACLALEALGFSTLAAWWPATAATPTSTRRPPGSRGP